MLLIKISISQIKSSVEIFTNIMDYVEHKQ